VPRENLAGGEKKGTPFLGGKVVLASCIFARTFCGGKGEGISGSKKKRKDESRYAKKKRGSFHEEEDKQQSAQQSRKETIIAREKKTTIVPAAAKKGGGVEGKRVSNRRRGRRGERKIAVPAVSRRRLEKRESFC